ncbi:uncharacterized protein LOC129963472 [Argiope bruennichi]|uniref:uncharacterized protein LOC129963472 n=1 Tax=Argiope bruennichi TaxID=94029 RepID=UPI002493D757|nr:uncharacterized protein LOC129963472 [Argiope bruennichi]
MLRIAIHIHPNILSSQCYIRYVDDSNSVDTIQVECFTSKLELLLLKNDEIIKNVKISSPKDIFIPSSLLSDSDSSIYSNSTIICRTKLTPAGQHVADCSFRLQISGGDQSDESKSEQNFDVKDYFKEQFKNRIHWNLLCARCGNHLPIKPLFIDNVKEYCNSELSEEWFCHRNDAQSIIQPSSEILYVDDISFYLYPRPNSDNSCQKATGSQKSDCINNRSTNCSNVSCSGINCTNKSAEIRKKTDQNALVVNSSVDPNVDSSNLKQTDSSVRSCVHHACDDCKHSTDDKNEYLNNSKGFIECQSCGDVLTAEKSPRPFIRFYFDKLMFKDPSCTDNNLEYARQITLLSFWSLVKKNESPPLPSRLFLQSKVRDEDRCLLLWIPNTPIRQFLLQDSFEGIPQEVNLKLEPVYKILYFVGTSHSEKVRSWRHDFNVDYYRVSDTMVKTIAEILDASSNYLPQTTEAADFSCGFMKAPSHLLQQL